MPTMSSMHLPKPKSWDEFEEIVCDAVKVRWNNPDITRHGRQGQSQQGVDIYGNNDLGLWSGVQCKNTLKGINESLIKNEIESAESFEPKIKVLYIATTADSDSKIQKYVRILSQKRSNLGKFAIALIFWNDVQQDIVKDKSVFEKHYPAMMLRHAVDSVAFNNKKICALSIAYKGLRISEYVRLIFGELGLLAGEDHGQIIQLSIEIKAYAKQLFDENQFQNISKDLDRMVSLCLKRCEDKEESESRWDEVLSLAKIIESRINVLETILPDQLLGLFTLGKILGFLDAVNFDSIEQYQLTINKYQKKILDSFRALSLGKREIKEIAERLKYATTNESISIHNVPAKLYATACESIKI